MVGAVGLVFAGVLAIILDETVQPVRDHHDGCLAGGAAGPSLVGAVTDAPTSYWSVPPTSRPRR